MVNEPLHMFQDRVVWVTGASSGIGRALAIAFSERGAQLVLSARRADKLEDVRAACAHPERHLVVPLDLTDESSLTNAAHAVLDHFGRVDVLVNNGGISQRSLVKDTTLAVDRHIMETNFFGTIALTKAVLPSMLERSTGRFVVISSLTGHLSTPLRSTYAASKHALHGFFNSLRAEVADEGLHVLIVCPGYIRTQISHNALTGTGNAHNQMDPNQEAGMSPEACAAHILKAIEQDKAEIYVGGKERLGIYIERFLPSVWRRMALSINATGEKG